MSTLNKFKRTSVAGQFRNVDLPGGTDNASAYFQRDVEVGGDLRLGTETLVDEIYTNTGGNICFNISGVAYQITPVLLTQLIGLAATLSQKSDISYVDAKVAELVDSSPTTLDTLNELAAALGNDPNFATTVASNIGLKADKSYTDSQLLLKADKTYTDSQLLLKADKTYTDSQLLLKADKTYTDAQLATKLSNNANSSTSAYLHFGLNAKPYTEYLNNTNFGSIGVNKYTNGQAEMNFIQNGFIPGPTNRAFNFLLATSNSTFNELIRINKNGDTTFLGTIASPTIATINTNINLKSNLTYVDSKLLLKDDITSVDSKLLLKDDITSVDSKLLLKDDITSVDSKLLLKDDITSVNSKLLLKDDITSVDSKLLLKDDITSVDSKLLLKDDIVSVDSKISNLQSQINAIELGYDPSGDISGTNISFNNITATGNLTISGTIINSDLTTQLATKADTSVVNAALALKADTSAVNAALALKADTSVVNAAISAKADKNNTVLTGVAVIPTSNTNTMYCNGQIYFHGGDMANPASRIHIASTQLMVWDNVLNDQIVYRWGPTNSVKQIFYKNGDISIPGNILNCPTISAINTTLGAKSDKSYVDSQLLLKADTTTVTNGLATKSDKSYVDSQLLLKADTTTVTNGLATKSDKSYVDSQLANKLSNNENSRMSAFLHFGLNSQPYSEYLNTTRFASVSVNKYTNGDAEMNFIQNGYIPGASKRAFNFLLATSNTTFDELIRVNKNGDTTILGTIASPTINNINTALGAKTDKSYVDAQLATKVSNNANSSISAYLHFGNNAQPYTEFGTQNFGSISVNKFTSGHASFDFIHNGFGISNLTTNAFTYNIATSNTTFNTLFKIHKNGNAFFTGVISSPTITTINSNITATNAAVDLKADKSYVDTSVNTKLALKSNIESPVFTGIVSAPIYQGNVSRSSTTSPVVFTASTLPAVIFKDAGVSTGSFGIPDMPIGTKFTVVKTCPSVTLYSTSGSVFFYTNRTSPFWQGTITFNEDSRTFIRAEIFTTTTMSMVQVWLTESSYSYSFNNNVLKSMVGAYFLDGGNNGINSENMRPIICSTKLFSPGNSDDGYIINEGFSLLLYPDSNYGGTPITLSNYNLNEDPKPVYYVSPMVNNMQSLKLYYNLVEVTILNIS